jgi:hypothetical protein
MSRHTTTNHPLLRWCYECFVLGTDQLVHDAYCLALQENDETSETISHSWFDQVVKALHSDIQAIGMDLQRAMQRYDNRQTQT